MSVKLGALIRSARQEKGLTQSALAKLLGYPYGQTVSQWERGDAPVPMSKYPELVRVLEISFEELLAALPPVKEKACRRNLAEWKDLGLIDFEASDGPVGLPKGDPAYNEGLAKTETPVVATVSGDPDSSRVWEELVNEDPLDWTGCMAARVHGDSMAPVVLSGQYAVFHPEATVRDGNLAIIRLQSGEVMFKRVYYDDRRENLICESIREKHRPRVVDLEDVEWCYKVVGVKF